METLFVIQRRGVVAVVAVVVVHLFHFHHSEERKGEERFSEGFCRTVFGISDAFCLTTRTKDGNRT